MKKISVLVFILIWSISSIMAQENSKVLYTAMYRYNHIHCTFLVNDIPTHSSIPRRPVLMSFVERIGMLLAEGENTFGIWAMDIPEDPKGAYCEMIINATVYNEETQEDETKEVASIRVTIDDKGNFVTTESKQYPAPTLTGAVTLKQLNETTFNQGVKNDVIASRSLTINHPHQYFSWATKSTPFMNTPENREKLWAKYEEFRSALAEKNESKMRTLQEPGLSDAENYMGNPQIKSYTESVMSLSHDAWEASDFKVLPIDKNDYRLLIGANGRLFRFIDLESSNKMTSPVLYQKNGGERSLNYTFTLIDGEIVNAY